MEEIEKSPKSILKSLKFTSVLGCGSFGIVFKSHDKSTSEDSAVKLLFPRTNHATWDKQFEKSILRSVDKHENIVTTKRVFEKTFTRRELVNLLKNVRLNKTANTFLAVPLHQAETYGEINCCIVQMELCGLTLRTWLKSDHCQKVRDTLDNEIVTSIIEGLGFLHRNNIIHRDLKPDNIFFSNNEYDFPIKIGDFGLSRTLELESDDTLTSGIGTQCYAAPEIYTGHYGVQADMFSMGLIIFEVLQKIQPSERPYLFNRLVSDRDYTVIKRHNIIVNSREIIAGLTNKNVELRIQKVDEVTLVHAEEGDNDSSYGSSSLSLGPVELRVNTMTNNSKGGSTILEFGIRKPVSNFVGRTKEIDYLREWTEKDNSGVLVLSGIGGIGKTELARQFINTFTFNNTSSCLITWFDGLSNNDLHKSLAQFSAYLGFVDSTQQKLQSVDMLIKNITESVESRVRTQYPLAKWIVVFDSVFENDELTNGLKNLINANASILITTRDGGMFAGESEQMCLQPLTTREACTLANIMIPISNQDTAEQLCNLLNNHPLAIQQAISYIKMQQATSLRGNSYGITSFIKEWSQGSVNILKHQLKLSSYNFSVYKTVTSTIEQIKSLFKDKGDRAIQLLLLLSLVQCEGIKLDTFYQLLNDCDKSSLGKIIDCEDTELMEIIESELTLLKCFSLVELETDIITMANLVQIVVKNVSPWEDVIASLMNGIKVEAISASLVNPAVCVLLHAQSNEKFLSTHVAYKTRLRTRIIALGMNYDNVMRNSRTQFLSVFSGGDDISKSLEKSVEMETASAGVSILGKRRGKIQRRHNLKFDAQKGQKEYNQIRKNCIVV